MNKKEYMKNWRKRNRKHIVEWRKKHYKKHKKYINQHKKEYRASEQGKKQTRDYRVRHYREHKEEVSKHHREYYLENSEKIKSNLRRKYVEDEGYRIKRLAVNKLHYALKMGKVKMKGKCEMCGSKENLNCHHPNYSKPLEFITACSQCHHNLHKS